MNGLKSSPTLAGVRAPLFQQATSDSLRRTLLISCISVAAIGSSLRAQTGCWLEAPPEMAAGNTITVIDKDFGEAGFPTSAQMAGKDVKIILPTNRDCEAPWTIGGTNSNPARNIWIVGGKIKYTGPLPGPSSAGITFINWSGTVFLEGVEIDINNACMDGVRSSTAVTNGANRRIVFQNCYIRGMGYCTPTGTHGDLYHAQNQNDSTTYVKELVVQNVRGELINQGFFIPYRPQNNHGVLKAVFRQMDLHLDPRYKFQLNKISTMIFAGTSGSNGDSPPPNGQSYTDVYLNWWDPWYPGTEGRLDITKPAPVSYTAEGIAVFSAADITNAKITGAWRKGVPAGGTYVPTNKVGRSYDRTYFVNGCGGGGAWTDSDIGAVGLAGSGTVNGGTYTVKGAGSDIGGTADSFNYMYESMTGDGTITVRLASETIGGTNDDKSGVMIRESTATGSSHVSLFLVSAGARMGYRASTGGSTTWSTIVSGTSLPRWFRLQRSGNSFTGSVSTNGTSWTTVGTFSVTMASSVKVGMAVCSRQTNALNTSVFDNVTAP